MGIELYTHWVNTNCTMVQLLIRHLGAEVILREMCVFPTEENFRDRFEANVNIRTVGRINFFSGKSDIAIPMLVVDSKNVMIETKLILKYFAEKYCENELLYPSNRRDEIDAALSFVLDELGSLVDEVYYSYVFKRDSGLSQKIQLINKALEKGETFFDENEFICGSELTIVDFCYAVITSILEVVKHDLTKFPKTTSHLSRCKELIRGWNECAAPRAKRYGYWYRVALDASESGGCPFFPKPLEDLKKVKANLSKSDVELYSFSLYPKCLWIQLLARSLGIALVVKETDLCHIQEDEESRKVVDANWNTMLAHLHFSDNEEVDAPPVLVDHGEVIIETGTILKHLLEKVATSKASQQLYPSDSSTRDAIDNCLANELNKLDSLVLETYLQSFENARTKREIDQEKVVMIQTHLKKLEEHLEEKDFMIGNSLTVVDLAYAITLGVLEAVDPDILLEFERVRNYFETCKESITGWEEVGASGLNLVRKWYNDCVDWTENGSCPFFTV